MKRISTIEANTPLGLSSSLRVEAQQKGNRVCTALWRIARQALACAVVSLTALTPLTASAATLSLADTPIFLQSQSKTNVMMVLDNSGSMDYEVLMPSNDGTLWWDTNTTSFWETDTSKCPLPATIYPGLNTGCIKYGPYPMEKYEYLFPNGYSATYNGSRIYSDQSFCCQNGFAAPPTKEFAFLRSPDYNGLYYNPDTQYIPWVSLGSATYGNISPTAAPWEPNASINKVGTVNLTSNINSGSSQWTFAFFPGMKDQNGNTIALSSCDDSGNTSKPGCARQLSYYPATYYRIHGTPDDTNFKATAVVQNAGLAPDGVHTLDKYEIKSGNYNTGKDYQNAIQNFANWFSYYRKRSLALRAAMGRAFQGLMNLRVGTVYINNLANATMMDTGAQQTSFYDTLYSYVPCQCGTPNRQALNYAGQQYQRTDAGAPIVAACEQNYALQFTDGFGDVWTGSGWGNADGAAGKYSGIAPFADSYSDTAADIAMHYYETNLRPDMTSGQVPTNTLDTNPNPHMVYFAITLSAYGTLYGTGVHTPQYLTSADAYANPPTWPDTNTSKDLTQIDDLYHAAVDGRGELLSATSPDALATAMAQALEAILARTSSSAAVALNASSLSNNSRVYQARFRTGAWTGQVLAYSVNQTTGALNQPELWDAGALLTTQVQGSGWDTNRTVITYDASQAVGSQGIPFRWTNLSLTMQAALNTNGQGVVDLSGQEQGSKRLEYLRGSAQNEGTGNQYRLRSSKLGDIIDSAPIFVGDPNFDYPDNLESSGQTYSAFTTTHTGRIAMVYVGANDGMLHGFDATTGAERLAYVPGMLFPNLTKLTSPNYAHTYFVDGTPTVGDAFWGGNWHTALVGGLNKGGQGIYALDVTDPSSFQESNASTLALWEFTDANDKDLGYTYSRPAIVRMANGKWAAVFGNGYNNTIGDGNASSTGDAVLYIVDLQTGSVIKKLDTGVGTAQDPTSSNTPNGLATVSPVDVNSDHIVDYIYAGDLFGNVWKFDVTDPSPTKWKIAYSGNPLFVAVDDSGVRQPITAQIEVGRHPTRTTGGAFNDGGYMLYFGTGKYLESADNSVTGTQTQTFYGIWDPNLTTVSGYSYNRNSSPTHLLQQVIQKESTVTLNSVTSDVRITTNNAINWAANPSSPANGEHLGWYMNLVNTDGGNTDPKGERVINTATLRNGTIIFTTLIPSNDPCNFGGDGWLMELNASNGSRLTDAPFDLDGDGTFDFVNNGGGTMVAPGGLKSSVGIPSTPGILDAGGGKEFKYLSGTNGGSTQTVSEQAASTGSGAGKRESWQQLR